MEQIAGTFASYRFGISILLALGGIICIIFGYRLFNQGAGLYKSVNKFAIKHSEFSVSITGMSTGGLLMLTSAAWAYYCYSSIPRFETSAGGSIKIVRGQEIFTTSEARLSYAGRSLNGDAVFSSDGLNVGNLGSFVFSAERKKWQALIEITQFSIDVKPHSVAINADLLAVDDQVLVIGLSASEVKELPMIEDEK